MKEKPKRITAFRTEKGTPFLWESHFMYSDNTKAVVILDEFGNFKNSIFRNSGFGKQSIVPITENDMILKSYTDIDSLAISIFNIDSISNQSNDISAILILRLKFPSTAKSFTESKKFIKDELIEIYNLPITTNILMSIQRVYDKMFKSKESNVVLLNTLHENIMKNNKPTGYEDLDDIEYDS